MDQSRSNPTIAVFAETNYATVTRPIKAVARAILLLVTVGAYTVRSLTIDVVVKFVVRMIAFFLRRSANSLAGRVLGVILGKFA